MLHLKLMTYEKIESLKLFMETGQYLMLLNVTFLIQVGNIKKKYAGI